EARRIADESRRAAEAAEAKAAQTKQKADQDAAATARAQAKKDELDAQHKEAVANLRDKEKTLADSKVNDIVQHRPPNAPSDATVTAQNEVAAAKKTVDLYEAPAGQPGALDQTSAQTQDLLKKAQEAGKVVFDLQAQGKEPSKEQKDALNNSVQAWLDAAGNDMRTAGAAASAQGKDPQAAINAEYNKIMQGVEDGGVFNPEALSEYVGKARDQVLGESPGMRQLKVEQYNALADGDKQLATARADASAANKAATDAEQAAAAYNTPQTDSQAEHKRALDDEAKRLRALADGAQAKVDQLATLYEGKPDPSNPNLSLPGTVVADYDVRIADLSVSELQAQYQKALQANDTKALGVLGPQLDAAIANQTLAHAAQRDANAQVALGNAQANYNDANAQWEAAKANQVQLKTVTYYGRGGKYTRTEEPDGYDKTFWLDYSKKEDRDHVKFIDGKYYYVEDQPLWFDDKKTELNPDAARRWQAAEQLANAKDDAGSAATSFKDTSIGLQGNGDGVPGKLDTGPWLASADKINGELNTANTELAAAQKAYNDGLAQLNTPHPNDFNFPARTPESVMAPLEQRLGAAIEKQKAAQAKADALKAMQELADARRQRAMGQNVSDERMKQLETTADQKFTAAIDAQPKLNAQQEADLRNKTLPDLKTALAKADAAVDTAQFAYDHATSPADREAKDKLLTAAEATRADLAHQVDYGSATLELIDAKRAGLAAKWEYDHTQFVKPQLSMYMDYGESHTNDVYPANYDPTWNVLPGQVPENAKVEKVCGEWRVTFEKDSDVLGVKNVNGHYVNYRIEAGSYKMNPAAAKVWETTNTDKHIGGSLVTRAQDKLDTLQPVVAPGQPTQTLGLDGKPVPTLNLTSDLSTLKAQTQTELTDATTRKTALQQQIDAMGGHATPELQAKLDAANADIEIATSQLNAIKAIEDWQAADRALQQYNADLRAGRQVTQSATQSLQEQADDKALKAIDARQQWITTRDKRYIVGAQSKVDAAQVAHDKWKADHPGLAGDQATVQTWKDLQAAKAELDRGHRMQAMDANVGAMTAQQQYIAANLRPGQEDDPQALARLFNSKPEVMAQAIINQHYVQYGSQPIEMDGRLRISNEVGLALGSPTSMDLDPNDPAHNEQLKRSTDLFASLDGDRKTAHDAVVDKIIELGGDHARVTVLPVVYAIDDEHGGIVKTALFKVERGGGQEAKYVDE
ncbi:MAG TPA: hypothetical protein VHQ87_06635, partial [Rhizobacter sp.]|nr:hypothetical protein [Rhizobacter sp.]